MLMSKTLISTYMWPYKSSIYQMQRGCTKILTWQMKSLITLVNENAFFNIYRWSQCQEYNCSVLHNYQGLYIIRYPISEVNDRGGSEKNEHAYGGGGKRSSGECTNRMATIKISMIMWSERCLDSRCSKPNWIYFSRWVISIIVHLTYLSLSSALDIRWNCENTESKEPESNRGV